MAKSSTQHHECSLNSSINYVPTQNKKNVAFWLYIKAFDIHIFAVCTFDTQASASSCNHNNIQSW